MGMMYFALPAIVVGLAVALGIVVSYRSRRTFIIVLIWLAILLLGVAIRWLGLRHW